MNDATQTITRAFVKMQRINLAAELPRDDLSQPQNYELRWAAFGRHTALIESASPAIRNTKRPQHHWRLEARRWSRLETMAQTA
jgi:hypothetical protein